MLTKELEIDATPYVILIILSSSLGGVATLIEDPSNLIIDTNENLTFNDFFIHASFLAIINLTVLCGTFAIYYRKKL